MPNISVTLPDGSDYATALASGALDNNALWSTHYDGLSGFSIKDTVTGAKMDATYSVDRGMLQPHRRRHQLPQAVEVPSRHFQRLDQRLEPVQHALQHDAWPARADHLREHGPGRHLDVQLPQLFRRRRRQLPDDAGADQRRRSARRPRVARRHAQLHVGRRCLQFRRHPSAVQSPTDSTLSARRPLGATSRRRSAGADWTGNIGLRLVHTKTHAATAINKIISVTVADTANPTASAVTEYSEATPLAATGSYTLPLPAGEPEFRPDPGSAPAPRRGPDGRAAEPQPVRTNRNRRHQQPELCRLL